MVRTDVAVVAVVIVVEVSHFVVIKSVAVRLLYIAVESRHCCKGCKTSFVVVVVVVAVAAAVACR